LDAGTLPPGMRYEVDSVTARCSLMDWLRCWRNASYSRACLYSRRRAGELSTALGKKTGQICRREESSISDLQLSSLASFFGLIWCNPCTRHIPEKLTPRASSLAR
jgi:hypothetical protein